MKILLISFSNRDTDGRLNELIKACKLIGETIVISCEEKKDTYNIDFIFNYHKRPNYLKFINFCRESAKQLRGVDIIFADNRAAIIPAMICKKTLKSQYIIYDARELYLFGDVHHLKGKIGCIVERIFIKKFDIITCANIYRAKLMKKLFKLRNVPLVFENIRRLEADDFQNNYETLNIENMIDVNKINIVSTSGCYFNRKCDILAKATLELGEDFVLYLIGNQDAKCTKAICQIKKQYNKDNIFLIDQLNKSNLKAFIQKCDIGIVSYSKKGINNKFCASGKIYEYLFEKIPVVTTSNPPLKAICEKYGIGISDDKFLMGIKTIAENIDYYKNNVNKYICDISPENNNNKLANEIMKCLGIKKECLDSNNGQYSNILFITSGFPTEDKHLYTFLDSLVCAMADLGKECTVIYPCSVSHFMLHKEKLPKKMWERITLNGNYVKVICPRIITFSRGTFLRNVRCFLNYHIFNIAVKKTIRKHKLYFEVVYGHFLHPSGFTAAEIGKLYKKPSCFAYGENTTYNVDIFGIKKSHQMIKDITACISVSSENSSFLSNNKIVPPEKIATIPNAVDKRIFYPRDKAYVRDKYNIAQDSFVVAFTGYFTDIKGSMRLSAALEKTVSVHSIFIGSGDLIPTCKNIDFIGSVPHENIPELLSAADIFVLPTLAEGCCNAILEALSCGLPVVSSDLPFNDDILNSKCSIRVDTSNVDAIADAISFLRDNADVRNKMSAEAIKLSESFDIKVRAKKILEWISICDNGNSRRNSNLEFNDFSSEDRI